MTAVPAPLPPSSPLLRRGRFEVTAFGPRIDRNGRRLRVAGPHRFATEDTARAYAEAVTVGDIVRIDRYTPHPRFADGPWSCVSIDTLNPQRPR